MNPDEFLKSTSGKAILTRNGYWAFVPGPLPPDLTWSLSLITVLSEADRAVSRLDMMADALPFIQVLSMPFVRQEAVLSSQIEGTRASLVDLYAYEAGQMSFLEPVNDVKEVHNYVRALEFGLERAKTLPVSLRLIREVHACLMDGVRGSLLTPGEFRRSQNWIGPAGCTLENATYVPPPVAEMQNGLEALENFIHDPSRLPPLVRAGMIHYQFEALHPFLDGNGRLGRLLIPLLLCDWKVLSRPVLNLSAYFESQRAEYYAHLLEVSRTGAWEEWLVFFLTGIHTQAKKDAERLENLAALRLNYRGQFQIGRQQETLLRVIDLLFQRPILTIQQIAAEIDAPYVTAERSMRKLVGAGISREMTGKNRNRIFCADEILTIIRK